MPIRIQRKRTKGWKMPEGVIYVGRGSKWGNPFKIGRDGNAQECVQKYEKMISNNVWTLPNKYVIETELKGKDLACWCKITEKCHADVLLKLANK